MDFGAHRRQVEGRQEGLILILLAEPGDALFHHALNLKVLGRAANSGSTVRNPIQSNVIPQRSSSSL